MALKRVKVDVTEDDYQKARQDCAANTPYSRPRHCLITTAVRRYVPSLRSCGTDRLFVPGYETIPVPKKVQDAVQDFDNNLAFAPLSFYITVPEELLNGEQGVSGQGDGVAGGA